jgi:hypothetical protein
VTAYIYFGLALVAVAAIFYVWTRTDAWFRQWAIARLVRRLRLTDEEAADVLDGDRSADEVLDARPRLHQETRKTGNEGQETLTP